MPGRGQGRGVSCRACGGQGLMPGMPRRCPLLRSPAWTPEPSSAPSLEPRGPSSPPFSLLRLAKKTPHAGRRPQCSWQMMESSDQESPAHHRPSRSLLSPGRGCLPTAVLPRGDSRARPGLLPVQRRDQAAAPGTGTGRGCGRRGCDRETAGRRREGGTGSSGAMSHVPTDVRPWWRTRT